MFKAIKNLFKKNNPKDDLLDIPILETISLQDVTIENVVKSNEEKAKVKDTKETKSTLTFGK
jgi:hypothetical protein